MSKKICFNLLLLFSSVYAQEIQPILLTAKESLITVNGKEAKVYSLEQADGTHGVFAKKGENFDVKLDNQLIVPTTVHWHGLILPNNQDGVANVTQFPIYPKESYRYTFPIVQAGTFWMHAHFDLQEQKLLSAPLILSDIDDEKIADQEAIIFLTDFSFQEPEHIYWNLKCRGMKMSQMSASAMKQKQDLNDVDYDAFLANWRTLDNPEIIEVEPNKKIRLRIINGASASNFFISLGNIKGQAIAIDGNRIESLEGSHFELAVAQRIDILLTVPENGGAFPILAQVEGTRKQTGVILLTKGASLPKISNIAAIEAGPLTNEQEANYHSLDPLPSRKADQKIVLELGGSMADYTWTINQQMWPNITPMLVKEGERVEITFKNTSRMSHPMHLHGHVFQVTAIDGMPIQGALRDTILVLPNSSATIQFDASHPGVWPLHCHILYHQEAGMMTLLRYENYLQPL